MSSIETTGRALVTHWAWAAEKGLMNRHTANALRTACVNVLEAVDGWEETDITTLDVDSVFQQFQTKRSKDYKPQTLEEYRRRFRQAVALFLDYARDPSGWQPSKPRTPARRRQKHEGVEGVTSSAETAQRGLVEPMKGYMEYAYRLPGERTAILRLPPDLTLVDVKRIGAFLATLATDFEPGDL